MRRTTALRIIPTLLLLLVLAMWMGMRLDDELARGRASLETNNLGDALEVVSHAVEENPAFGSARVLLGVARLRMHLYQSAIDEFDVAANLSGNQAEVQTGLTFSCLALVPRGGPASRG